MLYEKVKTLCEKKNMTVRKLEEELGFSNGAVSKWNKSNPSVNAIKKVADYFEITIDELLMAS